MQKKLRYRINIITILTPILLLVCVSLIAWLSKLNWVVYAIGAGFALVVTLLLRWFSRSLERALQETSNIAERIALNDPNANIPFHETPLELSDLSISLQRLVAAMRSRQNALEEQNAVLDQGLTERTQEITTLADMGKRLGSMVDLHALSNEILGELQNAMNYRSASIWLKDRNLVVLSGFRTAPGVETPEDVLGLPLSGTESRDYAKLELTRVPMVVQNSKQGFLEWLWAQIVRPATGGLHEASRSWIMLPLLAHDQMIGALRVDHAEAQFFSPERERLLLAISSQIALAVAHAQLFVQAQNVAVVAERNRIARDLHDAVSQTLFAANIIAGTLSRTFESDPEVTKTQLNNLQQLNRGALAELRVLLFELRPDALERAALSELLRHLVQSGEGRGDVKTSLNLENETVLPPKVKVQFYRIAQEAFSNALKHAKANHVQIIVQGSPDNCQLIVIDNGQGFDPNDTPGGHFGLENMLSRALEVGVELKIQTEIGEGTSVEISWIKNKPVLPAPPLEEVISTETSSNSVE